MSIYIQQMALNSDYFIPMTYNELEIWCPHQKATTFLDGLRFVQFHCKPQSRHFNTSAISVVNYSLALIHALCKWTLFYTFFIPKDLKEINRDGAFNLCFSGIFISFHVIQEDDFQIVFILKIFNCIFRFCCRDRDSPYSGQLYIWLSMNQFHIPEPQSDYRLSSRTPTRWHSSHVRFDLFYLLILRSQFYKLWPTQIG